MKKIFITGSSGFIGQNLMQYLNVNCIFNIYKNGDEINICDDAVIHLAGIAHDIKNVTNPKEYYKVNTELTMKLFDNFINSNSKIFIFISSVKAVADEVKEILTEDFIPNPITHYGKSKLLAEQYILSKPILMGKRIYIVRPSLIHGAGNKGNLSLLYNFVKRGIPWPLGSYDNQRSFCSIDNLCFVINELIQNDKIPSGVYNIADDEALSTNEIINLITESQGKNSFILNIPQFIIKLLSQLGDLFNLPLNTERLKKLTETYIVSNKKIRNAIKKPLPITAKAGLMKTLNSFGESNTY